MFCINEALETAALIGLDILKFWDYTPYEYSLMVKAYNIRKKEEHEEKLVLTYLGAYWQRVKKMPNLKQVLGKEQPKKQMTPEEMLIQIRKLNAQFGGMEVK